VTPSHQAVPGTLRLVGALGVDNLDPAASDFSHARQLQRLFARQLFTYPDPAAEGWRGSTTPVPDLAAELPSRANGGTGRGGAEIQIRLRRDVYWDTSPARPVTAHDVVRGLKRLACPFARCGTLTYFTSTIVGMAAFADDYAASVTGPSADACARFHEENQIPGALAIDDHTLRFTLNFPANDILNILALGCASAAPAEYDAFVPGDDGASDRIVSCGPYRIAGRSRELTIFEPNPAWIPASDPIRERNFDVIRIDHTVPDEVRAHELVEAGDADLPYAVPVPQQWLSGAQRPGLRVYPGSILNPYLVFNLADATSTMTRDRDVRVAIALSIDKHKVNDAYGTQLTDNPLRGVVPPGNIGFVDDDPYPTPGDRGDADRAKRLLAKTGFIGAEIRIAYRDVGFTPRIAAAVAEDVAAAGLSPVLVPVPGEDFYGTFLKDVRHARGGEWHIAVAGYIPDWYGNSGRSIIEPLFRSSPQPGPCNYGGYSNREVDRLIEAATSERDDKSAEQLWQRANRLVMHDLAIVPTQSHGTPRYHGPTVTNARFIPSMESFDLTALRPDLSDGNNV
jgi:peptide/nickel transport system substrate-binding protein